MKNKKLLNVYLLTLALVALITFILPIDKIDVNSASTLIVRIAYYAASTIMVIALVLIIALAIVNMFADNYEGVRFMQVFAFIAFFVVFANSFIYAGGLLYALSWGYLLLMLELFCLTSFNQFVKIIKTLKGTKGYFKTLSQVFKSEQEDAAKAEVADKPGKEKQPKAETIIEVSEPEKTESTDAAK